MRRRRRIVPFAVFLIAGCSTSGAVRYRDNPELINVKLATGRSDAPPAAEGLGVVEASASGGGDCDALVTHALQDLLAEAKAVGGSGVHAVRFKGRWTWTGHPICMLGFLGIGKSVKVRGMAVR